MKKQGKRAGQKGGDPISSTGRERSERQEAMRLIVKNEYGDYSSGFSEAAFLMATCA